MSTLEYTGERMVPEKADADTFLAHIHRYRFASKHVKRKDVLDVACGEGYGAAAMVAAGARSVVGIDISDEAVTHAKHKYGIDARLGDARSIPLPSRSVDLVISFETIEHVAEAEQFIDECGRVCRPLGEFIVSTPYPPVYDRHGSNPYHHRELMPSEFLSLLRRHFTVCRCYTQRLDYVSNWSFRAVWADRSPLTTIRGGKRALGLLQRAFCIELRASELSAARENVIESILASESWLGRCLNPYSIRGEPELLSDTPSLTSPATYMIAHCRKMDR